MPTTHIHSPLDGPFYFAWVDQDDTTFDTARHLVVDEDIFEFNIKHEEGQFCTLDLTVKNPRVGLLSAGRKLWAWLSYRKMDGVTIVPLFFGVLTGVPTDMFAELVQLKFNARPHDYIFEKQKVAETLKIRPFYDPVFLDDTHRDDPDAILEGWSALYHIDRLTHEVTISDILEGEDGTITFDQTQGIYESVKMELGEAPLSVVQVQAGVQWTQRCIGFLDGPRVNISSYTGGSFKGDWPKPGTELGGGWKCEASYVVDVLGTEHAKSSSNSSSFQNNDPDSGDCSTESMSVSITGCNVPGIGIDGHVEGQTGICDPDGFNADGSQGVNIPAKINSNGTLALAWALNCAMNLRYDAKREFTEEVTINVQANVQDTVVSPLVDQNTEVLKLNGANVGLPLLNVNAWTVYAGSHVDIGTIIMPNDRSQVGGNSYQVCIGEGTAGVVEPEFSDTPGDLTIDGTVTWASLGESVPSTQPSWTDSTPIPTGEIVLYEPKVWSDFSQAFETTGQSCFLIAKHGGTTKNQWVDFTYLPGLTSNDDSLPLPVVTAYIPGPGQTSPYSAPIFAAGTLIVDGSVTWMSLGTAPPFLGIPIGGTTENVTARSYFTKDRGHWSVEYLICKARARLRLRSRCVKVSWEAPFEDCLGLSLRKNATILDGRIPGGAATGKIMSYELHATKDGVLKGGLVIGCSVGFGNSVPEITGTPEYTSATGYMQPGYQLYDGGQHTIADDEIGYTPPAFQAFDDGLSFPLQFFPGTVTVFTPDQVAAVQAALASQGSSFVGASSVPVGGSSSGGGANLLGGGSPSAFMQDINPREYALEANPVGCEIIIRPVTNGPFNGSIVVECSTLEIPQGINLSAS